MATTPYPPLSSLHNVPRTLFLQNNAHFRKKAARAYLFGARLFDSGSGAVSSTVANWLGGCQNPGPINCFTHHSELCAGPQLEERIQVLGRSIRAAEDSPAQLNLLGERADAYLE